MLLYSKAIMLSSPSTLFNRKEINVARKHSQDIMEKEAEKLIFTYLIRYCLRPLCYTIVKRT